MPAPVVLGDRGVEEGNLDASEDLRNSHGVIAESGLSRKESMISRAFRLIWRFIYFAMQSSTCRNP